MATATKPLKSPRIDYRAMLLDKKAELVSQLRAKVESAAIPGGAGDEDIAREQYDSFVSLRIGSLAYQQLRLVNAALERLETGTYGTCLACGEAIPPKRLAAVPWASCCVKCQERLSSMELPRAG